MEIKETIRLYDQDAYAVTFEAQVLACEPKEQQYEVILDQTMFFPEGGGQGPDLGTLDGETVMDVQIKDGVIRHTMENPIPVGSTVQGLVNWKHRFDYMQQHSGEHIFSGLVHTHFGYRNVGFHLSDNIVTMDFDGVLSAEDVSRIEGEVNEVIVKNVPISVCWPDSEQLELMAYRSKMEIEGPVRIVTIQGYDACACCAPHVRNTGEIGMFKVMSVQNYKGGVRISMLCGFRALQAFREKTQVITELMAVLTTNQERLVESVSKMKLCNQNMSAELAATRLELLNKKLETIPAEQTDVLVFEEGLDQRAIRGAVNALVEKYDGLCGIFNGNDKEGYRYILASRTRDCKEVAELLKTQLLAQGGGSSAMIQGSVQATQIQLLECLKNKH